MHRTEWLIECRVYERRKGLGSQLMKSMGIYQKMFERNDNRKDKQRIWAEGKEHVYIFIK